MKNVLAVIFTTFFLSFAASVNADSTLTYELTGPDAGKTVKKFSISRFFVRIDDPADDKRYMIFQAGKFFPLFSVDTATSTYTRLTPKVTPYMGPETGAKKAADAAADTREAKTAERLPPARLKPTREKRTIAGNRCRVVHELLDDKPVIEHCMANSANLNITNREVITMSRVFTMSRNREFGWLGVSTEDEEYVSLHSRDLRDNRVLQLTSISTKPLAEGYLRIPRDYEEATLDTKSEQTSN